MSKLPASPSPQKHSFLTKPFFHFLILGGILFFVKAALQDEPTAPKLSPLTISAADIASIEKDWQSLTGAAPITAERARLIEQRIDDELLIEEAIARGWHLSDPVIQDRLVRNIRFLQPESQATDAEPPRPGRELPRSSSRMDRLHARRSRSAQTPRSPSRCES